jgi:hypothetical protein
MTRSLNALLALAALGFASTSFAQCPSSPVPPWSTQTVLSGGALSISAGGYDGTACKMSTQVGAGAGTTATAVVRDNTPADEARYRFQFLLQADALTGQGATQAAQIFTANSTNPFPAPGGSLQVLRVSLSGGGTTGRRVTFISACNVAPDYLCTSPAVEIPATGVSRIEGDLTIGGAGTGQVRYWVNNTTEGTPTGTLAVDNAGWVGIDAALMGLSRTTASFRASQAARAVNFDEFDSRRQTFIGN